MKKITKTIREALASKLISLTISILPSGNLKKKFCLFVISDLSSIEKDFKQLYTLKEFRIIEKLLDQKIRIERFSSLSFDPSDLVEISQKTQINIKNTIHQLHKK